jgi:RecA-family ATPase
VTFRAEDIYNSPVTDDREPVQWDKFWAKPRTKRVMLIDPLVGQGELTRLYAQAKEGKTLLAQEGVVRRVTGGKFLDRQCTPGDVLYIDQENTEEDWRERLESFGLSADTDLSRLHWYSLQSWPPLDTEAGGLALMAAVQRHTASLVVLDTQSKLTLGDEDRSTTQQDTYRHTFMPLKRAGVAGLVIDHAGNDPTRPRGSSEKRDDMDAVWRLSSRGKDRLTLTCTHSRRRTEVDKLYLYRATNPLRHVVDEPDEREEQFITRCVDSMSFLDGIDPLTASTRAVASALRERGKKFRNDTIREAHIRYNARRTSATR